MVHVVTMLIIGIGIGCAGMAPAASAQVAAPRLASVKPTPSCALKAFEETATNVWGFRNRESRVVVVPRFDFALDSDANGLASAHDANGWAYVDCSGKTFRVMTFDNGPDYFRSGLARFEQDGKIGYLDRRGRITIPATYEWAEPFCHTYAIVGSSCVSRTAGEHTDVSCAERHLIDRQGQRVDTRITSSAQACE